MVSRTQTAPPARPQLALSVPATTPDPQWWAALVADAEAAGLSFLVLADGGHAALDPILLGSLIAPWTTSLGVLPTVAVTHREPFHVAKAIATLDHVTAWRGPARAGWVVEVDTTAAGAEQVGLRTAPGPQEAWREAAEVIDVVRRLWDSWEDGAEIRDLATGRFIDRDRLHHIDFTGEFFSVRGPSITPRPPQGQPLVLARASAATAAVREQVDALIGDPAPTSGPTITAAAADTVSEVAELLATSTADAVVVETADPRALLAELAASGSAERPWASVGGTLRERFDLPAAVNRYAA